MARGTRPELSPPGIGEKTLFLLFGGSLCGGLLFGWSSGFLLWRGSLFFLSQGHHLLSIGSSESLVFAQLKCIRRYALKSFVPIERNCHGRDWCFPLDSQSTLHQLRINLLGVEWFPGVFE